MLVIMLMLIHGSGDDDMYPIPTLVLTQGKHGPFAVDTYESKKNLQKKI